MDIFKHITRLRSARRGSTLSAGAQALYYELLAINNEERWSPVFKCKSSELCSALSVSEKTLGTYRDELLAAGLIGYRSGRHKREPSDYSLNGSSIGVLNGSNNGGNIYHQTEHQSVSKTPDLIRDKRKSKNNTLEGEVVSGRAAEIENAVAEFCNPLPASDEKEKNVAPKKEMLREPQHDKKQLPPFDDAIKLIAETANWRNVLEFKIIPAAVKPQWADMDFVAREPYIQERRDLFAEFYAYKEDNYLAAGMPTWSKMADNFFHWVEIQKNKGLIQKLKTYGNGQATGNKNGNSKPGITNDRHARNKGIEDIVAGSESFLHQYSDIRPEGGVFE